MEFNEVLSLSSSSSESIIKSATSSCKTLSSGIASKGSQTHEIRNLQYYDEIHHKLSLNHCTLLCSLSCMKMEEGLNREGGLISNF